MQKLKFSLRNCYGIGGFSHEFDFAQSNSALIYAPNGVMKSSFAKTLLDVSRENEPKDLIFPKKETSCSIKVDGTELDPKHIFVALPEDKDEYNSITTFLASKELKQEYDQLHKELIEIKDKLIKPLKELSKSSDCESEFIRVFRKKEKDTFFDCLEYVENAIIENLPLYTFKYNDVFDKDGKVEKFLKNHQEMLDQYFKRYNELLSGSTLFKNNAKGNSFGTYEAQILLKSVKDNAFFDANHFFTLESGEEIKSQDELNELYNDELTKILSDKELQKNFNKIDKAITSNTQVRDLKRVLDQDHSILSELADYSGFRKKVWKGYLSKLKLELNSVLVAYRDKKSKLKNLLDRAKKETSVWQEVITIYNQRFYVPFKVELSNQEDVILKQEAATLKFSYQDSREEEPIEQDKKSLLEVLSTGEKRAFYILQIIFELEARKRTGEEYLLVFDDIADSFDYKNKYAILEYLYEIHNHGNFKMIVLTHNFDFYRTFASRLSLPKESVLMVTKGKDRNISCNKGEYRRNIFQYYLPKSKNSTQIFLSLIPFVRNLIEFSKGTKYAYYNLLTSCLHIKPNTHSITLANIIDIFRSELDICKGYNYKFDAEQEVLSVFYSEALDIVNNKDNINEISLSTKLVLSIASRLKAEEFLINKIMSANLNIGNIDNNQTRELMNKVIERNLLNDKEKELIDQVVLMTPENIHLNAFMYEPIIDTSVYHLIDLYQELQML
ncbi:hypothetical protein [Bacteroides sp.]|uniref:hypothetical protein n=1 Tax=Bacteroides sp. TaxID=29523 RepID=UPI0025908E75|nr:hypothetical protein [Bacteroides sp.]